jgi:hypothetical protein
MANSPSLTEFTSRVLGTMFAQKAPFIKLSYRGVSEYDRSLAGYAVADNVYIKLPGYPTATLGLTSSAESIADRTVAYTISNDDIYSVSFNLNFRELGMHFVDGKAAFMGDPNANSSDPRNINPQAKLFIDNYVSPAYQSINGKLEVTMAEKCGTACSYSPIDDIDSLGAVDSFSSVSSATAMMDELSFTMNRFAIMNVIDENKVSNSLQNMYNPDINALITRESEVGPSTGPQDVGYMGRLARQTVYVSNSIGMIEDCLQYTNNPTSSGVTLKWNYASETIDEIVLKGVTSSTDTLITAGTLLSLPDTYWINRTNKSATSKRVVVVASEDAVGDGAGEVTVKLGMSLITSGTHQNINSTLSAGQEVKIFPGHRKNFFFIPMGIVANTLPLTEIYGADNATYVSGVNDVRVRCAAQGTVATGINQFRISVLCPTLAIPEYMVVLPSAL